MLLSLLCLCFVVVILLLSLLCLWLLQLYCRCRRFRLVAVVVAIVLSVAFLSLLIFPSSVVASIVIVHAYLRREHDAVVLHRRHLMCPSHTYATPPLTEISNCAGSTPSVSKPVRLWFQSALCMWPVDVHVFSKLTLGRIDSSSIMIPLWELPKSTRPHIIGISPRRFENL